MAVKQDLSRGMSQTFEDVPRREERRGEGEARSRVQKPSRACTRRRVVWTRSDAVEPFG